MARPNKNIDTTTLPGGERLYVGIDVGKDSHVAALISTTLLDLSGDPERCPTVVIENSRAGFDAFTKYLLRATDLANCMVVMEHTGSYSAPLDQYLVEVGIQTYYKPVPQRPQRMVKSDKRDAIGLGLRLYNQLEHKIHWDNKAEMARPHYVLSDPAAQIGTLMRRHRDLTKTLTRCKNQLHSIGAELFPERAKVFADPSRAAALALCEKFPTPMDICKATLSELKSVRQGHYPSDADLLLLQELASTSIGITDVYRLGTLVTEQSQLIAEMRLAQAQMRLIVGQLEAIVEPSREGQILLSVPGIRLITASTLIAAIGNIDRFSSPAALRSYLGWGVRKLQTGTTLDSSRLGRGGTVATKKILYMVALTFTKGQDSEWSRIYTRLMRGKSRNGKAVLGRIAGQVISVIHVLLTQDRELVNNTPVGSEIPPPGLYNPDRHNSKYRTLSLSADAGSRGPSAIEMQKEVNPAA